MRMRRTNRQIYRSLVRAGRQSRGPELEDGSRVAVVGGGPSGSFFAYFLLKMAESAGLRLEVEVYEPRHFTCCGPAGCNHCGGIVSESLVQLLATEGINLPETVVQRGIESYVLHMDVGTTTIDTPLHEKRIAAVFRGNGPRDASCINAVSFDLHLQRMCERSGARIVRRLVTDIVRDDDGSRRLVHADGPGDAYDLVALAVGVNSNLLQRLAGRSNGYRPPRTAATYICELQLDAQSVDRLLGSSMHVFLLNIPRIEFAAMIPKGDIVTLCLLGEDIDPPLVRRFLDAPEVRACFPADMGLPPRVCHCSPMINVGACPVPYGDRLVVLGDSGVTRLYKDGIGAAYRTAKSAAVTAVFQGVSGEAFKKHFRPACRSIERDNRIGVFIFAVNHWLNQLRLSRKAILHTVRREQAGTCGTRYMSRVLWDLFTGSAPYREVLVNMLHPGFAASFLRSLVLDSFAAEPGRGNESNARIAR
jgi:flavin-dependent dehydrogenase